MVALASISSWSLLFLHIFTPLAGTGSPQIKNTWWIIYLIELVYLKNVSTTYISYISSIFFLCRSIAKTARIKRRKIVRTAKSGTFQETKSESRISFWRSSDKLSQQTAKKCQNFPPGESKENTKDLRDTERLTDVNVKVRLYIVKYLCSWTQYWNMLWHSEMK